MMTLGCDCRRQIEFSHRRAMIHDNHITVLQLGKRSVQLYGQISKLFYFLQYEFQFQSHETKFPLVFSLRYGLPCIFSTFVLDHLVYDYASFHIVP